VSVLLFDVALIRLLLAVSPLSAASVGNSSGSFRLFPFSLPFGDEEPKGFGSVGDGVWLATRRFLVMLLPGGGDERGLFLLLEDPLLSVLPSLS
jgi:hypothetical protein